MKIWLMTTSGSLVWMTTVVGSVASIEMIRDSSSPLVRSSALSKRVSGLSADSSPSVSFPSGASGPVYAGSSLFRM